MTRNLEEFNGKYKGQEAPCFIIAAGTSIHFQNLEPIKQHLSIAVNSGYVAAPWADFFISDDWSMERWSFYFKDLRNSKHTTVLLYENKLSSTKDMFGDRAVLFRHRKGISISDTYVHDNPKKHIGETRTSVGTAIMVAHIMGCSPIVLLGVDCCRNYGLRYFWQLSHHLSPYRDKPYKVPYRNDNISLDRYKKCRVRDKVTDTDLIEISKTWKSFGMAVNKKCKVYNSSDISLITVFPKIRLEDFLEKL